VDDERGRRVGLNEAVFREVNERIEDLAETFQVGEQPINFICECADPGCAQQISMPRSEYERVRADPTHFAVYPGHEIPDVEQVLEKHDGYDVVRKREGEPAEVARETDQRT